MGVYAECKYMYFRLESIPAGVFGETYGVSVGIHTSGSHFKGEWYVLTKRPKVASGA